MRICKILTELKVNKNPNLYSVSIFRIKKQLLLDMWIITEGKLNIGRFLGKNEFEKF